MLVPAVPVVLLVPAVPAPLLVPAVPEPLLVPVAPGLDPEAVPACEPPPGDWAPEVPVADPDDAGVGHPWARVVGALPDCESWLEDWPLEDVWPCEPPPGWDEPELDWLPLAPPLPPLVCWDGNGDWLPLPDWLWVLPGLPPEEDGAEEGEELGIDGMDGMDVCVDVVVEQPAKVTAQAMDQ